MSIYIPLISHMVSKSGGGGGLKSPAPPAPPSLGLQFCKEPEGESEFNWFLINGV